MMRIKLEKLIAYGREWKLIEDIDLPYVRNRLFDHTGCEEKGPWESKESFEIPEIPQSILQSLVEIQVQMGLVENLDSYRQRWMMDAMDILMPRPSQVKQHFEAIEQTESSDAALSYFYALSQKSGYIQMDQISKNEEWIAKTDSGDLEITINLSKPEKDPKEIALQAKEKKKGYPTCALCVENVGNGGDLLHPARRNHRVIPVILAEEAWSLQFSPYLYYQEHCICLNNVHLPMKITETSFVRLFDFVDRFPGYFIGSNADLPIVGGSILSHDHFQGGRHLFPMMKAEEIYLYSAGEVDVFRVEWPMSAIRLRGYDREAIIAMAVGIQKAWCRYDNPVLGILAETDQLHQTITPIVRKENEVYCMEIVLRNNRQSAQYPDGIFHPHQAWHAIKKENIGLIEVMGRAILPARLQKDRMALAAWLMADDSRALPKALSHHQEMVDRFLGRNRADEKGKDALGRVDQAIGLVFEKVLEDAGVFKQTKDGIQAFEAFIRSCQ
ncbi:UDP-glucose--hexose-1-phosphate uridylyltransferase [Gottschalkiaceae bacterium SANA]|nr:UDP-glucose--hexose-1-phosphate uridylyltransferase [Gottschalkiaceae bacterium SANA]